LAVNVPVTVSEPEIVTLLQVRGSSPARAMSTLLSLSVRQDELTVQVPTTLPPQAVPFGHETPLPPVPLPPAPVLLPPVPVVPPVLELPPVPEPVMPLELQAPVIIAKAAVIARNTD
jgi:hypothetical protein